LGKNINNMKRKTEALLEASKEISLKVRAEKMWHMFVYCHQNAGKIIVY